VPDSDRDAILKILIDHGVDFVVIGATAAILQGVPIAATLDLDVSAATSRKNLSRLVAALSELEALLRTPDGEGVPFPIEQRMLSKVSSLTLITRHGPFDVLFAPDGAPPYEELSRHSVEVRPFRLAFRIARLDDLIAMKRAAGREKDAAHLTVLLEHVRSLPPNAKDH
jgi:hypothetical protein